MSDQWIKSSDCLPQFGESVLGWHTDENRYVLCCFNYGKWSAVLGGIGVNMKISHWMALPNQPI